MKCPACWWCADGSRSQLMILEWNASAAHMLGAMRSRASVSSLPSAMAWPRLVRVSKRSAEWRARRKASSSSAREASSRVIAGSALLFNVNYFCRSASASWTVMPVLRVIEMRIVAR